MNKFNLTFSGEILAGHDPALVRLRFGQLFAINDPVRLESFFSGQTIILRRNLERKEAARYYHELHLLGVVAALVKVTTSDVANAVSALPPPPKPDAENTTANQTSAMPSGPQSVPKAQTWAVSSSVATRGAKGKKTHSAAKTVVLKKPDTARRDKTDIAARIKPRQKEPLHPTAEKEAGEKSKLEEQQRTAIEVSARLEAELRQREVEEAAQQEALVADAARNAAEEEAQKAAELARQKAEEAARRKVEQEEIKRQKAEEAAQKAAELARQKAEKAAQREAEREQAKRRRAEEAARIRAEKAEARREAAAEAARQKAVQREQEKAERARKKAEEAARRKAEREETKRREAEAARQHAEQQEAKRRAAEEVARLQAELEEIKRREAEEAARLQSELDEIRRQEADAAARLQAEHEERERQAIAAAARIRDEAQRKQEEAQRQSAQRRRAVAVELSARRTARKTQNLKVDSPHAMQGTAAPINAPLARRRQPGEPNLYKLKPFRNTEEVRSRAALAHRRMRQSYAMGILALAALLIAGWGFLRQTADPVLTGAAAVAVDPGAGPLLLAGDSLLLHDRAGVSTKVLPLRELGVDTLQPPLAFDGSGALLAAGRLHGEGASPAADKLPPLLRCELSASKCQPFSAELEDSNIDGFVTHPLDGSLILADTANGQLLKVDRDGKLLARATVTLPPHPVLRLHAGLLLMNSAEGPAISVLRFEDNALGQQLDEILLLPPTAQQSGQTRVGDFLWSGNAWWASLYDPESGSTRLYRFDEEWNYLDQVALPANAGSLQLANWGEKTLVSNPQHLPIQRYSAEGAVEAPFVSGQLQDLIHGQQRRANLTALAWRGGLLVCAIAAALGIGVGYLQRLRKLVYTPRRERGAEPVDDHVDSLQWIDPIKQRPAALRRRAIGFGLLALAVLILAIVENVSVWQLAALLLVFSGPAIALQLLQRQPLGHIGILGDRLLLVDHSGMYHLAGSTGVQYRGPFLLIDDVVVFVGTRLLPAFSTPELHKLVTPLAQGGVRADRQTVLVKLLQSRHPLALGACAILAATTAAIVLLTLYGSY